jgi:membrane-bound lytic murein transglycosylase B
MADGIAQDAATGSEHIPFTETRGIVFRAPRASGYAARNGCESRKVMGFARKTLAGLAIFGTLAMAPPSALAACGNDAAGFNRWLADIKQDAGRRFSGRALAALDGITYDQRVIRLDRTQGHFSQSFEEFARGRVEPRLREARRHLQRHAGLLAQIEQRYGVPPPIIVAIWGMETDFGAATGNMNSIRSLATLAYDCRRTEFFTNELMAALEILDRGHMTPNQMRGAWAGELGQTQFLASNYLRFGVDFDGNGRIDLIRSTADALGSTGNFLERHGWRRGQPWNEGTRNFDVIRQWNRAGIVARTIAYFANRLAEGS